MREYTYAGSYATLKGRDRRWLGAALAQNGLRYPFATYGIQQDVRAGMGVSYPQNGG